MKTWGPVPVVGSSGPPSLLLDDIAAHELTLTRSEEHRSENAASLVRLAVFRPRVRPWTEIKKNEGEKKDGSHIRHHHRYWF